jgi:hypothetical protein
MSFCLTFLTALSAIGCSPDAGQRDPPGPLAKHDEAQLPEFCLEFLHLAIRSLTNMACRSNGMSLDKISRLTVTLSLTHTDCFCPNNTLGSLRNFPAQVSTPV